MDNFKFSSFFYSSANIIAPNEEESFFATASLANLQGLLPADINPKTSPDILYLVANGAVAGMMNANGDSIRVEDALDILGYTKNKYINVDHKKDKVVGFVITSGCSKFGESTLLTAEEALKLPFFNLAIAGGVWRALNKELTQLLIDSSDPSSINYHRISLSWEIFFNAYDIAVGSKIIKEARIITDEAEKEKYKKYLRKFGGSGQCDEGYVYRVVKNIGTKEEPSVVIGGYSFVVNPAAAVKGIEVVEEGTLSLKTSKDDAAKANEDVDWVEFPAESGSLGIPREEMPQIKAEYRGALVQYLGAKGISYSKESVLPKELKPTQAKYSKSKVEAAKSYTGGNRAILVSADNYIIDGHHQWMASLQSQPDQAIKILRLTANIQDSIAIVKTFPSSETATSSQIENDIQEKLEKTDTNVSQKEIGSVSAVNNIKQFNIMDVKSISDIQANWESISKMESQAGVDLVVKTIRDELVKASEDYVAKAEAEKAAAAKAREELAEAMKTATEMKAELEKVKAEMDAIKAAEMQRIAAEKYNERIAEIECEYDLEDAERQMVASKVKDMSDDAYAAYKKEFAVMCKEKSKAFKKAAKEKAAAEEAAAALAAANGKTKEELAAEALAAAEAAKNVLTPGLDPIQDTIAKMQAAFSAGIKIKGQK